MKNILFIALIYLSLFCSCSVDVNNPINGQWQLKTIEENGVVVKVDTVFYSFQSANKFSLRTLLNPDEAIYSLGYLDFISDKEIKLWMDTIRSEEGYYVNLQRDFLELSGWDDYTQTFTIESINRSKMILLSHSPSSKKYSFKKF